MGMTGVTIRWMLVASVIAMLVLPMLGIQTLRFGIFTIQEHIQSPAEPTQLWAGFRNREWQAFLENRFVYRLGDLRSFLILSYNEVKHRLFQTRPNSAYVWTPEMGYFPVDTIRRLNDDVVHREVIKHHYQRAARRLRILQTLLSHQGVTLLVLPAPAKVRLYPEHVAGYLIAPAASVMDEAVSYGDVLEHSGVNVINVQRILAAKKAASRWPFFTTTSFHWSYWTGCAVADQLLRQAEALTGRRFFAVDCSNVEFGKSRRADTDIAMILNVFSRETVIGYAPFPNIAPRDDVASEVPELALIGDSFTDQIVYALEHAIPELRWMPDWLTLYPGFSSRQAVGMSGAQGAPVALGRDSIVQEVLSKKLLIIEVSDGHVYRNERSLDDMEYGATRILLDELLPAADQGLTDPKSVLIDGWSPLGKDGWRATGQLASIVIASSAKPGTTRVVLDVEQLAVTRSEPRFLNVLLDGRIISRAKVAGHRGDIELFVPNSAVFQDHLFSEISLQDPAGKPLDMVVHGIRISGAGARTKTPRKHATTTGTKELGTLDFINPESRANISVEGFGDLESNDKERWRWALGPKTRVKFYVDPASPDRARRFVLKLSFKNGISIPDQCVTVRFNGKEMRHFSVAEMAAPYAIDADIALAAQKGVNVLEFIYQDWNRRKNTYVANDSRNLAVIFTRFALQRPQK
jgi:hypothetical protein